MGLEIFYDLHAPAEWSREDVRQVLEAVRQVATGLAFAKVDSLIPNNPEEPQSLGLKDPPDLAVHISAHALDGWFFRAWPGKGCETANFGLCWFAASASVDRKEIATGWG